MLVTLRFAAPAKGQANLSTVDCGLLRNVASLSGILSVVRHVVTLCRAWLNQHVLYFQIPVWRQKEFCARADRTKILARGDDTPTVNQTLTNVNQNQNETKK